MKQNNYFQRTLSAMILLMASSLSWAYDFKADGIYYNINEDEETVEVTSGDDSYSGNIIIPSTVSNDGKTLSVTSIGNGAFSWCGDLISVTIPNSVTSIGEWAFENCSSLTSINIPNSVTSIGYRAFGVCRSLTSVTIPDGVTSIGGDAFAYCSSLTSATIGKNVTSIDYDAFRECSNLTFIIVDKDNPVYDSRDNCNAIIRTEENTLILGCQNTVIPESVTSIGFRAFYTCNSLTSVNIPENVTSIDGYAFEACSSLTSITVDENNPVYDSRDNCNAIIITEDNILIVGCQNTIIPESVTSIWAAFSGCSGLTSINIPDGVTYIGHNAFNGCSGLTSINIPDGVTSIGDYAFSSCSGLTSINIPDGVTYIGWNAFSNCSGLTSINIPDGVTYIGHYAFSWCSGLTSITIPNSVTSMGNGVFWGCDNLTSVYSWIENPFSIYDVFSGIADDATLYVPQGTKEAYEATEGWPDNFKEIVELVATGISEVNPGQNAEGYAVYDLNGTKVSVKGGDLNSLPRGIYVVNGKKTIVK